MPRETIHNIRVGNVTHEFEAIGRHRVVADDGCTGEWASYKDIAALRHHGMLLIAVSDHLAGELSPEAVYIAQPLFGIECIE